MATDSQAGIPRLSNRIPWTLAGSTGAGVLAGAIEVLYARTRGPFPLIAMVDVLALTIAFAGGIGLALFFIDALTRRLDASTAPHRWPWLVLAGLSVGSLPGSAALELFRAGAALWWLVVLEGLVWMAAAAWFGARIRREDPARWAACCLVAALLIWRAIESVNLSGRISDKLLDPLLALLIMGHASTLALAWILETASHRPLEDDGQVGTQDDPRPVLALGGGLLLMLACAALMPGQYATVRLVAFTIAIASAGYGFAAWLPPVVQALALGPLALSLVALVELAGINQITDGRAWPLLQRTSATTELFRRSGLLATRLDDLLAEVADSPRLSEGAAVAERAAAWNAEARWSGARPRTVLLITIDSLRYDHIGYSGGTPAGLTPRLDDLSDRGARFHRAYAQGGWTSISLPSLIWSKHPAHIFFTRLYEKLDFTLIFEEDLEDKEGIRGVFQAPVREPDRNLAEVLEDHGVRTLAVLNGSFTRYFNPEFGFARGFGRAVEVLPLARDERPSGEAADDSGSSGVRHSEDRHAVDVAIGELDALAVPDAAPLFLWVHLFGPHAPYDRWPDSRGDWSDYEAEVHEVDRQVGRLVDAVESRREPGEVLVIVTADHGEALGEHGRHAHGLNGYESSLRVPLIVAHPSVKSMDHAQPVGLIDIAPTIALALGVSAPSQFEGFALTQALAGDTTVARPPVVSETWRQSRWEEGLELHVLTVTEQMRKVVLDLHLGTYAFFDLAADPDELENLASSDREVDREPYMELLAYLIGVHGREAHDELSKTKPE